MPNTPPQAPAPPPRYMTITEVARQLRYNSRGPVYDLIATGALAASRPAGKSLRINRDEFERYCALVDAQAQVEARARAAALGGVA